MSAHDPKGKAFLDRPEAGKDGSESARFARNFIAERESAALYEALAAAERTAHQRQRFGPRCAWISVAALSVAAFGALLTEFSGIEGAGELFEIAPSISLSASALFVIAIVTSGSHRFVERVAIALIA